MASTKRRDTELGMGAVRASRPPGRASGVEFTEEQVSATHGVICPEPAREDRADEELPLAIRNTLAVPSAQPDLRDSGARRRFTMDGVPIRETAVGVAPPALSTAQSSEVPKAPPFRSATPAPTSGRGRYSSQPDDETVSVPPRSQPQPRSPSSPSPSPSPALASRQSLRRPERPPVRIDAVGPTTIDATHGASRGLKPRIVDRSRIATNSLSAREASVLSHVDGVLTVQELVAAAGIEQGELMTVLTRLGVLGIVALR